MFHFHFSISVWNFYKLIIKTKSSLDLLGKF